MNHYFLFIVLSFLSYRSYPQESGSPDFILKAIDKHGKAFIKNSNISSVSIGVLKDGESYTQHFGELEKGKGNVPDNESIYEVGSVTKTMVGYLVAKAVAEEKISLEKDLRIYLEGDYPNLEYNNKPITIKHLLTHTSGLPVTLPVALNNVFKNLDENVPQAYHEIEKSYDKEQFLADLKTVSIDAEPGTTYSYSNAGAELIGYVLEKVYRKSINDLLKDSFADENPMLVATIEINEVQEKMLVRGYWMDNATFSPAQLNKLWATGGGIKMDMKSMLHYMALQLNAENPIISESHKILYDDNNMHKVAYFWDVRRDKYGTSYNHHGGTTGTQNWLFIFPKYQLGISIITNHSGPKTPKRLSKTVKKILKDIVKA